MRDDEIVYVVQYDRMAGGGFSIWATRAGAYSQVLVSEEEDGIGATIVPMTAEEARVYNG